jgi:hypothetical protein
MSHFAYLNAAFTRHFFHFRDAHAGHIAPYETSPFAYGL